MKKLIFALALALSLPTTAGAQTTLDGTYSLGRFYDIPQREFTMFHIPGLELNLPPATGATFKAQMWFDAFDGEKTRTDLFFYHTIKLSKKIALLTTAGNINYFRPFTDTHKERRTDWVLTFEGKFRLKQW